MSKFAKTAQTARPRGATATLPHDPALRTREGGKAWALDARTELFTLAVNSFFNGDTFYESDNDRMERFVAGAQHVTLTHPEWMAQFIPWLRGEANMRTASVIAAVEFARTFDGSATDNTLSGRQVLAKSLQRADEPAEALAYHLARYGKPKSHAVKRGIGDAARLLYTEYAAFKYDQQSANVRMGDVIELCHPRPGSALQSELFQYLLDRRHGRDNPRVGENMNRTRELFQWRGNPTTNWLPDLITWENMSSYMEMNAAAWEAVIPKMGYMALLRNLRNFEQAGVDDRVLVRVATRLTDPEQVAQSRQLPFRFYSAYNNVHTERFKWPLSQALGHSIRNVPTFPGRTLVLVDTSGSMQQLDYNARHSARGNSTPPVVQAALFGSVVHSRAQYCDTWIYAAHAARFDMGGSILANVLNMQRAIGVVGHSTQTWPALRYALGAAGGKKYDRIFIFTDMQSHPSASGIDATAPIHVWDLGGVGRANVELGSGRYLHAGLSDQSFKIVSMLENYREGVWPWEA